jgi:hypothetical protein
VVGFAHGLGVIHLLGLLGVLLLLFLRKSFKESFFAHKFVSFQIVDGVVHGLDQAFQPPGLFLQGFLVRVQCPQYIEITASHDLLDLVQRDVQFTIEQDLLQPQQGLLPVVAIAVIADTGRLEKPDRIIMMQGARRDARQFGELLDREHVPNINPDVTLTSREEWGGFCKVHPTSL